MSKMTIDVELAIELSSDSSKVRSNREHLKVQAEKLRAAQELVNAMCAANRRMCKHPNGRGYTDYGGGYGFSCSDCGESS